MLHKYTHVIKLHKVITAIQMLHIVSRKNLELRNS